jgi:hypothetical protein|uniref:NADAR domain-containing protein n=1 Tax=viral metagenome TaxID=1070528 RepID=A0A6C0IDZ2_9ZZZZ
MSGIQDPDFPYNEETQLKIQAFFKSKVRKPNKRSKAKQYYTVSEKGDLNILDESKTVISTIPLQYYRDYSKEELDNLEKERREAIIKVEEEIESNKKLFRETNDMETKFNINSEIQVLELKRSSLISPYKSIKDVKSIDIKDIILEEEKEKRKMGDLVYQVVTRNFPLWKLYGKYTVSKEVLDVVQQKGVRLELGEVFLTNGRVARLFNKEDDEYNGFLSIYLVKEFIYNDINFSSPYQAFEYTRLKLLKQDELAEKLLTTRSVRSIRHWVKETRTMVPETKQLWEEILKEFYTQNSDLMKKLLETKDAILSFVSKAKYLGGIGIDIEDEDRFDTSKWKYKDNIVGDVLMNLRKEMSQLPEEGQTKQVSDYEDSVVSEEEVQAKKKAAIINTMKKKVSFNSV